MLMHPRSNILMTGVGCVCACVWGGGGLTRVVVIRNLQLFHKIVFPKVSLREHYFCYAAGNPNYIMIEEIQRTSYITVTFVIFTPSPPLSVGGGTSLTTHFHFPPAFSIPSPSPFRLFLTPSSSFPSLPLSPYSPSIPILFYPLSSSITPSFSPSSYPLSPSLLKIFPPPTSKTWRGWRIRFNPPSISCASRDLWYA